MVDFQERDTRRSIGDGGEETAPERRTDAGDETADGDAQGGADGDGPATGDGTSSEGTARSDDDAAAGGEPATEADAEHETDDAQHDHHAADLDHVSAAVLTVSSSRTVEEDASGAAIVEILEAEGHEIATRDLVNDDYDGVQSAVDNLVSREDVQAVVTTGGTGVAPEDVTPEALRPLFEKELPGFGELFRARSREAIGTKVIATRAMAGIADGVPVFCLPGSEAAVRLGTAEVVEPQLGHLAGLSRPHDAEE